MSGILFFHSKNWQNNWRHRIVPSIIKMKSTMEKQSELFVIPVMENPGAHIIYAPLENIAFIGNERAATIINKRINGIPLTQDESKSIVGQYLKQIDAIAVTVPEQRPMGPANSVVIILSQICNLACSYCFAQQARSSKVLPLASLKASIDYIWSHAQNKAEFVFIGGGEPTVTWKELSWAIEYIDSSKPSEKEVDITLTTNATLLSEDRIRFLKEHKVSVTISFEVLPRIQNSQRKGINLKHGTFDIVDKAIKCMGKYGLLCTIRSTITRLNVDLMPEMVTFAHEHYGFIKKLHFEPVSSCDDNDEAFYQHYLSSFFEAKRIGDTFGIDVYNSVSNSINTIKSRFCRGEFCITPGGDIVSCHRLSSENVNHFETVHYGYVDDHIHIKKEEQESALALFNQKREECDDCFAKWHCAGGCPAERLIHTPEQRKLKCWFTQAIIAKTLYNKVKF